jgi:hypothetical protein
VNSSINTGCYHRGDQEPEPKAVERRYQEVWYLAQAMVEILWMRVTIEPFTKTRSDLVEQHAWVTLGQRASASIRYKHDVRSSLLIERRDAGYSQDALDESGCRPGTHAL